MTDQPSLRSVRLDRIATKSFGPDWPQHVSAFAHLDLRTLQRIRKAAQAGEEHPAAAGVLAALGEAVAALSSALQTPSSLA